jgi:hypothetical protein
VALGRTAGEIVRRSAPLPTPLRRGVAAAVATGGVLSLAGVAATIPWPGDAVPVDPGVVAAAAVLPVDGTAAVPPTADPADGSEPAAPQATLVPVAAEPGPPATEQLDTAKLVKAVQLAERASASPAGGADDPEAEADGQDKAKSGSASKAKADPDSGACGLDTSQLGAVKPHVRSAAKFLGCRFGEPTVLGVAGRAGNSDHPSGKALDFMVDKATGNSLAACALRNQEALGVAYVIWRQRINFGSGWKPMEDRGGATANHLDHVHVSFESAAGGRPSAC